MVDEMQFFQVFEIFFVSLYSFFNSRTSSLKIIQMNSTFSEQHPIWHEWLDLYLRGEADDATLASLKDWVAASNENGKLFQAFLKSYKADVPAWAANINADQHWSELRARMTVAPGKTVLMGARKGKVRTLRLAAAGAAAAIAAIVATFYWSGKEEYQTYEAFAEPITVVLPDSTTALLNSNSKLRFLPGYGKEHRNVEQHGQVFYQVTPNTKVSFKVKTSHSVVKVLGTSFDLKENSDGTEQLAVLTGAVSYEPAGNEAAAKVLKAGQSASLGKNGKEVLLTVGLPAKQLYWSGNLVFEQEKVEDIVAVLKAYYKADIELGNTQLGSASFTGSFERESLDEVLQVICYSLNMQYTKSGDRYTIQPKK
jgi:transmembrane sensor